MNDETKKKVRYFIYILLIGMLCVIVSYNEHLYKAELLFALFMIAMGVIKEDK